MSTRRSGLNINHSLPAVKYDQHRVCQAPSPDLNRTLELRSALLIVRKPIQNLGGFGTPSKAASIPRGWGILLPEYYVGFVPLIDEGGFAEVHTDRYIL